MFKIAIKTEQQINKTKMTTVSDVLRCILCPLMKKTILRSKSSQYNSFTTLVN